MRCEESVSFLLLMSSVSEPNGSTRQRAQQSASKIPVEVEDQPRPQFSKGRGPRNERSKSAGSLSRPPGRSGKRDHSAQIGMAGEEPRPAIVREPLDPGPRSRPPEEADRRERAEDVPERTEPDDENVEVLPSISQLLDQLARQGSHWPSIGQTIRGQPHVPVFDTLRDGGVYTAGASTQRRPRET